VNVGRQRLQAFSLAVFPPSPLYRTDIIVFLALPSFFAAAKVQFEAALVGESRKNKV
jgi:hypothetical protein